MGVKISANFENIDFASVALSKIQKEYNDVKSLKIKNKNRFDENKPHTLVALSYYSQAPFDGVNYASSSMIPNRALPVAFNEDLTQLSNGDANDKSKGSVSVEVLANNMNYNKICNKLRTNGGYDIKATNN